MFKDFHFRFTLFLWKMRIRLFGVRELTKEEYEFAEQIPLDEILEEVGIDQKDLITRK